MKGALRNKGPLGSAAALPRPFNQDAVTECSVVIELKPPSLTELPQEARAPSPRQLNAGKQALRRSGTRRSSPNPSPGLQPARLTVAVGCRQAGRQRRRAAAARSRFTAAPQTTPGHTAPSSSTPAIRRPAPRHRPRGLRSQWARPSAAGPEGAPRVGHRGSAGQGPAGPADGRRVPLIRSFPRVSGGRAGAPPCRPARARRLRLRASPAPGRRGGAATPPSRAGPPLRWHPSQGARPGPRVRQLYRCCRSLLRSQPFRAGASLSAAGRRGGPWRPAWGAGL